MRRAPWTAALLAVAALVIGCATPRPDVPMPPQGVDLRALAGTWYVIESTFPMWLKKGGRADPAFHYEVVAGFDRGLLLDDRVTFLDEEGRPDAIEGIDTPDPGDPSHLTWRGKGWLTPFTSDWYVVIRDPADAWAVIYFSATIATPEGVDIIARTGALSGATLDAIRAAIHAHPGLEKKAAGVRPVNRRERR